MIYSQEKGGLGPFTALPAQAVLGPAFTPGWRNHRPPLLFDFLALSHPFRGVLHIALKRWRRPVNGPDNYKCPLTSNPA